MSADRRAIVILTGDETRHRYFRRMMAADGRFRVAASICEGAEKGLAARTEADGDAGPFERLHVAARTQSEIDFFASAIATSHGSTDIPVEKGAVNHPDIVERIVGLNPDLLICYGSSLIRSELMERFQGRFLNVHLGLSPYYRGSGTNVWPLVNCEPDMVGATFMHIDEGIDTGAIIHQIRADIVLGDGPHSIGNRLIARMTAVYADIVANFGSLTDEEQPQAEGRLYRQADWDEAAAEKLYSNFRQGMVEDYVMGRMDRDRRPLVVNSGLARA